MIPRLRMTHVEEVIDLSPHMRRIVLRGIELSDFPENKESAHVKVFIPERYERKSSISMFAKYKSAMRSYTIRAQDPVKKTLTLDFAVNDHDGRISHWANHAKLDDVVGIAGPGSVKHPDFNAPSHLLIGDLTALPAIAATLERLPQNAVGNAFIQVPDVEDKQTFNTPPGINIEWLIEPYSGDNVLLAKVKNMVWPIEHPAIFLATEATHVKEIKGYLLDQKSVHSKLMYSSAYWNVKKR